MLVCLFFFIYFSGRIFYFIFYEFIFYCYTCGSTHLISCSLQHWQYMKHMKIWFNFFFLIIHSTAYLYKFIIYNRVHWQNVVLTLPSEYGKGPGLSSSILNESTIHVLFCLILLWADIVATHCSVEKDKIKLVTF